MASSPAPRNRPCATEHHTALLRPARVPERRPGVQLTPLLQTLAGVATASVLLASPVNAGVVLEQPQLKRINATESVVKKPASNAGESSFGINIDIGSISLPLTFAVCVGLYLAGSKFGDGFESFMTAAWLKDSTVNGVGYEEEIVNNTDFATGTFRKR